MSLKYIDEYRDAAVAREYVDRLAAVATRPWAIMEVCGGQTHSIIKHGVDRLMPAGITLLHGPGCPVCVTPMSIIDAAIELAGKPGVILCSFGDMLRVPGRAKDLLTVRAEGGDVRIVYSPLDALAIARDNPQREVVFFAVGFETTAPANAMAAYQARREGLGNFSLLVSQVLVPPALRAMLSSGGHRIDGLLAPGHVCTIAGFADYEALARDFSLPIVVTGFEPIDLLQGILMTVRQLEAGRAALLNQYTRSAHAAGNRAAREMIAEVFEVTSRVWRGLGAIESSGLRLRAAYRGLDAAHRFGLGEEAPEPPSGCISGAVLQGLRRPNECPEFGRGCRPERPLGATMVSSEGACAAYFRYRRPAAPEVER